jgi:hypothetical protein
MTIRDFMGLLATFWDFLGLFGTFRYFSVVIIFGGFQFYSYFQYISVLVAKFSTQNNIFQYFRVYLNRITKNRLSTILDVSAPIITQAWN